VLRRIVIAAIVVAVLAIIYLVGVSLYQGLLMK